VETLSGPGVGISIMIPGAFEGSPGPGPGSAGLGGSGADAVAVTDEVTEDGGLTPLCLPRHSTRVKPITFEFASTP
jgi:hypothetical protein